MGNVFRSAPAEAIPLAPADPAFYALLPPHVFDTEHYVYAECQRINLAWHVRPILSGRTIASLQAKPNYFFTGELGSLDAADIGFHARAVSEAQAHSGLDTYRFSYVCFALAGTWTYGVVTQSRSSEGIGYKLFVKMDNARRVCVALNDPTLLVLTLAGYALRPFEGLPLASHPITTVETGTAAIVGHFLGSDRHATLDYAALGLSCLPRLPPPSNMLLPCTLENGTQCELSVDHILNAAHATYQKLGREDARELRRPVTSTLLREPDDATEQDRPSKRQKRQEVARWIRSKDGGTLTTADVPDLKTVAVGAQLSTTTLSKLFANYGDFPLRVHVRKEMKMAWDLMRVNFTLPDDDDSVALAALQGKLRPFRVEEGAAPRDPSSALRLPLLLTGSPGIGKSVLLMLFCAYLGVYHDVNVLLTRRVKYVNSNVSDGATRGDAVFLFRGGHVTKYPDFNRDNFSHLLDEFKAETRAKGKKILIVGDGYVESNFQSQNGFTSAVASSNILSTSAQYRIKDDDNRVPLTLPAWSKDALCDACAIYEEAMSTFEERYVLAGGNLRAFLVSPRSQWLSRCSRALADEDEIRRTYIQDIDQYWCYLRRGQRVLDAGVVQRHWIAMERIDAVANALRWVETTSYTALYKSLYEAMIHKLAFHGVLQLVLMAEATPLVVTARFNPALDNASKVDCISYLRSRWIDKTYWAPNYYVLLPGIDAICVQDKCVYYLQMSVTPVRQLPWDSIQEVHDVISSNPHLAGFDSVYVIVTPPATAVVDRIPSQIDGLRVCYASAREAAGARNLASLL